ncbi:MAG: hypothetical protein ACO1SV_21530 [Fimbriimonas sp.]
MIISGASTAAVASVTRSTLTPGWVKVSPGDAPTSYTDEGGPSAESSFKARLTSLTADESAVALGAGSESRDVRQTYRMLADLAILTTEDQVRHQPTNRLFKVLAIETPPTGGYGMKQAVVAEIP